MQLLNDWGIKSVAYVQGVVCCTFGLFGCSLSSIDCICDVLIGINSVSGVAHFRAATCVLHSTVIHKNTGRK